MSTVPTTLLPIKAKPCRVALVQLGDVTSDKSRNLKHARDMILKAAVGERKPDLVVLPVSVKFGLAHAVMWSIPISHHY